MSYYLKLSVRLLDHEVAADLAAKVALVGNAGVAGDDRTVTHDALWESAAWKATREALWPDDDSVSMAGAIESILGMPKPDVVEYLVYRELGDDYPIVEGDPELSKLSLKDALVAQYHAELGGDYGNRLAKRKLEVVGAEFADGDHFKRDEFSKIEREWDTERSLREAKIAKVTNDKAALADLLAYARVLARRGRPAERGWSPAVVDEYVKAARETAADHLARIAKLGVDCAFDKLAEALEKAAKYVRSVNSERVEA